MVHAGKHWAGTQHCSDRGSNPLSHYTILPHGKPRWMDCGQEIPVKHKRNMVDITCKCINATSAQEGLCVLCSTLAHHPRIPLISVLLGGMNTASSRGLRKVPWAVSVRATSDIEAASASLLPHSWGLFQKSLKTKHFKSVFLCLLTPTNCWCFNKLK